MYLNGKRDTWLEALYVLQKETNNTTDLMLQFVTITVFKSDLISYFSECADFTEMTSWQNHAGFIEPCLFQLSLAHEQN